MDALLTRRQTLQSLATAAAFSVGGFSLFSLAGCGGGGNGGGGATEPITTTKAKVPIELPSGFPLPVAELEAGTAFGSGTIKDGAFQAKVNAKTPTFAYLRQKSTGKFVLFGMVGAGRTGVTPLATAATAMALHFGWAGYSGATLVQVLGLLEANPDVKALGETIAAAIRTDPFAVTDGEASVKAAMKTAIAGLNTGGGAKIAAAVAASRSRATDAPLIQVQPSGEQFGARIDQGEDGFVVPTNLKRRPVSFYTYLVGHDPAAGSAIKRVDQQDLLPTGTILGQIASLNTRPAFAPVVGKPVELPISGEDTKTFYETVALMGTFDNAPSEPSFFRDPKYAGEVAAWRQKTVDLRVYSSLYATGADIFHAAGLGSAAAFSFAGAIGIANGIQAVASDAAALVLARAQAGKYGEFVEGLMTAIREEYYRFYSGGSSAWRRIGYRIAGLAEAEADAAVAASGGAAIAGIALLVLGTLAAAGTVLSLIDVGASYFDALGSPLGVQWTETALKPGVRINPRKADLRKGQSLTLSANVVGLGTATKYIWTLEGSDLANLSGGGKTGRTVETTTGTVQLATTPSTQGTLRITVEAKSAEGRSFGKDVATLTLVENKPVVIGGALTSKKVSYPEGEGTRTLYSVGVGFSPVSGATSYYLEGTGGNDTLYYGTHIKMSGQAPIVAAPGEPTEIQNCFGLTGGSSPGDGDDSIAFAMSRFNGFVFTITAYFT